MPRLIPSLESSPRLRSKTFAVIADLLDEAIGPILRQPQRLAEIALDAEQAARGRIIGIDLVIDILRGDARLLGVEHGEIHPFDDVEPLVVALPHCRAERFLRDDLRQDDVLAGVGELRRSM